MVRKYSKIVNFLALEPTLDTNFIVAGYKDDGAGNKVQVIYKLRTKGNIMSP